MDNDLQKLLEFWSIHMDSLLNCINNAYIREEVEEAIWEYKTIVKIQKESPVYHKFNLYFLKISDIITDNFSLDDQNRRMLLPELKKLNYDSWLKMRFSIIDLANKFNLEFEKIIENEVKSKISVEGVTPIYDKIKQAISFGDLTIDLKRDGLENAFCLVLFDEMVKSEGMSWDIMWEKMNGALEKAAVREEISKNVKKQIYDIHIRLQKRIRLKLKNQKAMISQWKNKQIIRAF